MASNDDFHGKATNLKCFYLHINFEQKYPGQTGHSDIPKGFHNVYEGETPSVPKTE